MPVTGHLALGIADLPDRHYRPGADTQLGATNRTSTNWAAAAGECGAQHAGRCHIPTCRSQLSDQHDHFAFRPTLGEVRQRLPGLLEGKHLVDHRPDALRLEELSDLGELVAVGAGKEE